MKSEQEVIEYKVGVFVLAGLVTLGVVIFLLGGESSMFTEYYQIAIKADQVQGIQNGSVVSVAGMKAGNVTDISYIEGDGKLTLILRIDREFEKMIRTDGAASFRTQGALGDRYIYIEPGSLSSPQLQPGEYLPMEESSDIFSQLNSKGKQIDNAFKILEQTNTLLKTINGNGRTDKILSNFLDSSEDLKLAVAESRKLLLDIRSNLPKNGELNQSFAHLSSILKKIDEGKGTLGTIINDPSLHNRLVSILGGEKRSRHLKSLIRESIQNNEQARGLNQDLEQK